MIIEQKYADIRENMDFTNTASTTFFPPTEEEAMKEIVYHARLLVTEPWWKGNRNYRRNQIKRYCQYLTN